MDENDPRLLAELQEMVSQKLKQQGDDDDSEEAEVEEDNEEKLKKLEIKIKGIVKQALQAKKDKDLPTVNKTENII